MKPKRVDCFNCENFIPPDFKTSFKIIPLRRDEKASCNIGKRVMFRMPTPPFFDNSGWFRYCNEFKNKTNEPNNN